MRAEVSGGVLPVLTLTMEQGESIITEGGGMSWMTDDFEMKTTTNGGLAKGFGRMFTGESMFQNKYICKKSGGEIAFASGFPGAIKEVDLEEGESFICQKGTFLCSEPTIELSLHFRKKFASALFGGEGFVMQKLHGHGRAFLEIDGSLIKKDLYAGDVLKVDNGLVVGYTSGIDMDIEMVKGMKNIMFGGEGLFLATLKGEGTVYLQTMPVGKLAQTLSVYSPSQA